MSMKMDRGSFGEFLAGLRGSFPSTLVGDSEWKRLLALADRLPAYVTDHRFGFEFALCDPVPAADFCVVPVPGCRLAEFYVAQGRSAPPGTAAAALGSFLAEAEHDPQALPARAGGGVILEYDLVGALRVRWAPPGIFMVPQDSDEESARRLLGDPKAAASALWAVAGWEPDATELRQVQRIYGALSSDQFVSQAGVMPGRDPRALRLIVRAGSVGDAVEMLVRLRWPGSPDEVAAAVDGLEELTKSAVGLSIDVTAGGGVSHRIGVELFRPVEWYELDRSGWGRLIDRLAERDLCLPQKAQGLRAWPRLEPLFAEDGVYRIRQTINHVKVVVERGEVTAKAYAGMYMQRVVPSTDRGRN